MPGVDLWDEVNGDLHRLEVSSAEQCRAACLAQSGNCGAWTFTANATGTCRLKAVAHRSLLVMAGSPGCFFPTHGNWSSESTSGFIQQKSVRFAQLYVDRSRSWLVNGTSCGSYAGIATDCSFGHFGFVTKLITVSYRRSTITLSPFDIPSFTCHRKSSP